MANIVVTKTNNGVYVDFGVYASSDLRSPQGFNSNTIQHVEPYGDGVYVYTTGRNPQIWPVCHTETTGFMIIDTIDGQSPTSKADMINKLTALM